MTMNCFSILPGIITIFRSGSILLFLILIISGGQVYAQPSPIRLTETAQAAGFTIAAGGKASPLMIDTADAMVVRIAATALSSDVKLVTGLEPAIHYQPATTPYVVIIGTLGHNKLIDALAAKGILPVAHVKGKWETFCITIINNPAKNIQKALVIAGSDPRGTAFGVFELSRIIGVSPWVWWADAVPQHREAVYLSAGVSIIGPPSVRYRGIFINDEDWGQQPWAAKTFEPETGDIGPKTYAKVFELLLRLRANLIWPAMHPSTKPFYHYPRNKQVAADYAIVTGSSHAEPMMRNNVGEWDKKTMGDFNYLTNKSTITRYWGERVKESSQHEVVYSLGMRGVHDSGMEGVKNPKDAVPLLEGIFADQRNMLKQHIDKDVTKVPQAFTAYKEVLDIYDNNLKVPDDVTLVWPDDNYGYIQRLSNEKEKQRAGGSGVYYHASYWGRPHDYLWLGTTHPGLMREEMMKAYDSKADRLWVLNVGDIKPIEYNMEFFLDMAFNAVPFKDSKYTKQHLLAWAGNLFGKDKAPAIQQVLWQYYQLAFERKPEYMGWSQTEPTTKTSYTTYNHFFYGDEAQRRIDQYDSLERAVKSLRASIRSKDADAFYELVYYPVRGASLMNKKFLYRDKSYYYARQNRLCAYDYARLSKLAYDSIVQETDWYNTQLASGKWKNMLSMAPRNLPVYQEPVITPFTTDSSAVWGVAPEGDSAAAGSRQALQLPAFDVLNRQQYFIDLFLTNATTVNWTAAVTDQRIRLSAGNGSLSPAAGHNQVRIWVKIDWHKGTAGSPLSGQIRFTGAGKTYIVSVTGTPLSTGQVPYQGFIENNGLISMYATHYSRSKTTAAGQWKVLDDLGYTGQSLQASFIQQPTITVTEEAIKKNNPWVAYDFYSFSTDTPIVTVFSLPTHPLHKAYSMRYALSIDDDPLTIVDFRTAGRSEEWKQNVLRNSAIRKTVMSAISGGRHTLKIYSMDPGVVIDRILLTLGSAGNAYSTIAETCLEKDIP